MKIKNRNFHKKRFLEKKEIKEKSKPWYYPLDKKVFKKPYLLSNLKFKNEFNDLDSHRKEFERFELAKYEKS